MNIIEVVKSKKPFRHFAPMNGTDWLVCNQKGQIVFLSNPRKIFIPLRRSIVSDLWIVKDDDDTIK